MTRLSYQDFLAALQTKLKGLTREELEGIILDWASEQQPSQRKAFLASLANEKESKGSRVEKLLQEIEYFQQRVVNGSYCSGWGWDEDLQEERDWGDESWAGEMDELLLRTRDLVLDGWYDAAARAYADLFATLDLGRDPGHLPGRSPAASMLDVDLAEQLALFLSAVYLASQPDSRVEQLWSAWQAHDDLASTITLQDVLAARGQETPGLAQFLPAWSSFLAGRTEEKARVLLHEAIYLAGGWQDLRQYAREHLVSDPESYLYLARQLQKEGQDELFKDLVREALSVLPAHLPCRAELGQLLAEYAQAGSDCELALTGWQASFTAKPAVRELVHLLATAIQCDEVLKISAWFQDLLQEKKPAGELDQVQLLGLLLTGRYDLAGEIIENKGGSARLVITSLLLILAGQDKKTPVLFEAWQAASCFRFPGYSHLDRAEQAVFLDVIHHAQASYPADFAQEESLLAWAGQKIKDHVDTVVSSQARYSYEESARLLIALAEVLTVLGRQVKAQELVSHFRRKYNRHSTFQKKLQLANQTAGSLIQL